MKPNLCLACKFYVPASVTEAGRFPPNCSHERLKTYFGNDGIKSICILHCDCFEQLPSDYGDVRVSFGEHQCFSYIVPTLRDKRVFDAKKLYDNSKDIVDRIIKI